MGKRFLLIILITLSGALVACGGVYWWGKLRFESVGPLPGEHIEIIKSGSGLEAIAQQLEKNGIIHDALIFELGARLTDQEGTLKAGEFVFPAGVSSRNALKIIRSGKTRLRRLTIPEGHTSLQIVDLINNAEGLKGSVYFPIPPEGTLLPETYYFSYGEDRQDLVQRITVGMNALLSDLWSQRAPDLPIATPEDAIILASIVEKETGVDGERKRVASVFVNRLRLGMRLQSDPTVIYGITLGQRTLGRPLSKADLREKTPYNTYVINGLPPGPIANPGRAAIEAVLHPEETDFLYFVADGTGGHAFSRTLEEHNRNVRKWRKLQAREN